MMSASVTGTSTVVPAIRSGQLCGSRSSIGIRADDSWKNTLPMS
jgi:hypothetical protein